MTLYPAEAAMAYLDLYDATHDEKYLTVARTIADTYLRLQLKCGTWYQILDSVTGEAVAPNLLVPTYVILFFDRLRDSYGITKYESVREKAFNWIMANTMKTYNWQGQFEDVGAKAPYEDQSNPDVTGVSIILFNASDKHPEYLAMAKEMLRFAEDQFVVWDRRDAVAGPNWAIPSALEQYVCYTPINASNHALIRAFIAGYKATGDTMYKAKALALADTLTVAWKDFGSNEIPTWMNYGEPSNDWMNCSVVSAITLIDCEKLK
jgi:maltose/maltodextrin transport system substrate-binding protein